MSMDDFEAKLRRLAYYAWEQEVKWPEIEAWIENFKGEFLSEPEEKYYAAFFLTRFVYFGKGLIREMLKSLYRDNFQSPICQRIRRNYGLKAGNPALYRLYQKELITTRFIGVGNPAESGAHLLYYFRQVNGLSKELFSDIHGAFESKVDRLNNSIELHPREAGIRRCVFFDDVVGSGTQARDYLRESIGRIRRVSPNMDIRFLSLFSTKEGMEKINRDDMFRGKATCMFELDETYKAFFDSSRYFYNSPEWFEMEKLHKMAKGYGEKLWPDYPLGYKDGQLLLGFSHNTPDNSPPIFWSNGASVPWSPVFIRYNKLY